MCSVLHEASVTKEQSHPGTIFDIVSNCPKYNDATQSSLIRALGMFANGKCSTENNLSNSIKDKVCLSDFSNGGKYSWQTHRLPSCLSYVLQLLLLLLRYHCKDLVQNK